ncbi:undecaprenyl-diphosphate phosphatase [soil metagenome]
MPLVHAIVLGIVQGLSEFLPISSSGHLALVPWLFGWDDFGGDQSLAKAFDVALHLGTLAGALAYFRKDLVVYAREGTRLGLARIRGVTVEDGPARTDGRIAWLLVLSAIPAAITGVVLDSTIERLDDEFWLIAVMLIVFGLVLLYADRLAGDRSTGAFRTRDAVAMGVGQALALQPGVSRSGVTITVGRRLGFSRDAAARLSFLMSLPIIAGAGLYKLTDVLSSGGIPAGLRSAFAAGMVTSALTGWLAVWATLRLVRTRTFTPFVVYRVIAGVAVLGILASSFR